MLCSYPITKFYGVEFVFDSVERKIPNLSDEWRAGISASVNNKRVTLMDSILILTTGGTIDKVHDTLTEDLVFSDQDVTQVPELLKVGRCYFPDTHGVLQKDSLDMNDQDREKILQAVLAAEAHRIVITHGTGTIAATAKYLDGKVSDKIIILTGAMRPHSLGKSDAGGYLRHHEWPSFQC